MDTYDIKVDLAQMRTVSKEITTITGALHILKRFLQITGTLSK